MYSWEGEDVEVTPRNLRPTLPEGAPKWKQNEGRETTPDRALRKMIKKIRQASRKAARGKQQRIVARGESGDAPPPKGQEQVLVKDSSYCPALEQLDDPVVLSHLRAAYTFLGSAELHYCQNCDEEWVIFTEAWPQGGVSCAGPRAGVCETISRSGYQASWAKLGYCSRCASQSAYRAMFKEANLQHLGPRDDALSNLTWYESLLIARVHPVISVVTLTATGLLCYAGHVCNYYVKVLEWFRELPASLRHNNNSFQVKRRKSILSTSPDVRQKKPTIANRSRLEAAFAAVRRLMPRVYEDSTVSSSELAKFSWDGETEMLEQTEKVDLSGEVRLDREVFSEWLDFGQRAQKKRIKGVASVPWQ